jgi:hypothetical protein
VLTFVKNRGDSPGAHESLAWIAKELLSHSSSSNKDKHARVAAAAAAASATNRSGSSSAVTSVKDGGGESLARLACAGITHLYTDKV